MMNFEDFIKFFLAPLLTIFFVFALKILSRKKDEISNEDRAVGLEILIGNISIIFIELINDLQVLAKGEDYSVFPKALSLTYLIAALSAVSLVLSLIIRARGWNQNGSLSKWAVNISNIVGLLSQSVVWMILTK